MKLNSLVLLILLLGCDGSSKSSVEFPVINMNAFQTGLMEVESNDVSYILNSTKLSPISIRLSWQPIDRVDLTQLKVYRVSNGTATLLKEIDDIEKTSTIINSDLQYEIEESFQLSVIHENGDESPLSNSNTVGLFITYGEPDDYTFDFNQDTLQSMEIIWSNSGNGLTNPIINVDAVRNNLLDSISINVLFKQFEFDNYSKIFSAIGAYTVFGTESSFGQGDTKTYTIDFDELIEDIYSNQILAVSYDDQYFDIGDDDPFGDLFKKEGFYEIFFYFYKRSNGRRYVYRSSLTETITFPR